MNSMLLRSENAMQSHGHTVDSKVQALNSCQFKLHKSSAKCKREINATEKRIILKTLHPAPCWTFVWLVCCTVNLYSLTLRLYTGPARSCSMFYVNFIGKLHEKIDPKNCGWKKNPLTLILVPFALFSTIFVVHSRSFQLSRIE